jgi:hypothetical protein
MHIIIPPLAGDGYIRSDLNRASQIQDLCKVVSTQSTEAVMPTSTAEEHRHRHYLRKALAENGADPFEIAAEAIARAERLEARIRALEAQLGR